VKRSRRTALTVGAVAVFAGAAGAADVSPAQRDVLSGIDVVITQPLIESVFPIDPAAELIDLARDPTADTGVRLRAYRALSLYPSPEVAAVLAADIALAEMQSTGTDALFLRAQIEALGELQRSLGAPDNYQVLLEHLYHQSRDVRAATADALRVMRAIGAIDALYARLSVEPWEQVRQAIMEAVTELSSLVP
jgi:hypothetical protein